VIVGCEDYQRDSSGRISDISKSAEIRARWLTAAERPAGGGGGGAGRLAPERVLFVDDDAQVREASSLSLPPRRN
jgi:hypothetical protein